MKKIFPFKKKRIVDRKLLDTYQGRPCVVCYLHHTTTAAHIRSRGAGGDDTDSNLVALCFTHHREQHDKGWWHMWNQYWRLKKALIEKGWEVNECGLFRADDGTDPGADEEVSS